MGRIKNWLDNMIAIYPAQKPQNKELSFRCKNHQSLSLFSLPRSTNIVKANVTKWQTQLTCDILLCCYHISQVTLLCYHISPSNSINKARDKPTVLLSYFMKCCRSTQVRQRPHKKQRERGFTCKEVDPPLLVPTYAIHKV